MTNVTESSVFDPSMLHPQKILSDLLTQVDSQLLNDLFGNFLWPVDNCSQDLAKSQPLKRHLWRQQTLEVEPHAVR